MNQFIFFGIEGSTFSGVQVLLLGLHSGITPEVALGTIHGAGDRT